MKSLIIHAELFLDTIMGHPTNWVNIVMFIHLQTGYSININYKALHAWHYDRELSPPENLNLESPLDHMLMTMQYQPLSSSAAIDGSQKSQLCV